MYFTQGITVCKGTEMERVTRRKRNQIRGKIVAMKGDMDVGILVCNKEIIPFNMKGMDKNERREYLCNLILNKCEC